jgi:hypothetical protein|tara:strand:- start:392 stop:1132 length:741 start_codon:yes stop_codon:yes gene_type:complete
MASVNVVYNTLKDLANKEQKGFVTPSVFNNFAAIAQVNVFKDIYASSSKGLVDRVRRIDPSRNFSKVNNVKEDLSVFSKTATITKSNGVFAKPDDLIYLIGLTTNGSVLLGQSTRTNIEIVYDESKIDHILKSDLSAPSDSHPIALVSSDIEVFPSSVNKIRVSYYKYPQGVVPNTGAKSVSLPNYAFNTSSGVHVFDAANSIDFELPDHYVPELVVELAKLIGINLRDKDVFGYGQAEELQKKTK